jgi:RES domain-containing protein
VTLWRVATETRAYVAADLSGAGAAAEPGRWNDKGDAMLYAAPTVALATLETAAHVDPAGLPMNKFLVRLTIPAATWAAREELDVAKLSPAWKAIPAGATSVDAGTAWLRSGRSALLLVPSVIVPEERCVLISPAHADSKGITAKVVRPLEYDLLFRTR